MSIVLYRSKSDDYLKILTDNEVKDFAVKNFGEDFKCTKENLYAKQDEEQNLRKVAEPLYIFLTKSDEVEKYVKMIESNSSDNCEYCYDFEILYFLIQNNN